MKKFFCLMVGILAIVVTTSLLTSCGDEPEDVEQLIVGKWTTPESDDEIAWVFNADHTFELLAYGAVRIKDVWSYDDKSKRLSFDTERWEIIKISDTHLMIKDLNWNQSITQQDPYFRLVKIR